MLSTDASPNAIDANTNNSYVLFREDATHVYSKHIFVASPRPAASPCRVRIHRANC